MWKLTPKSRIIICLVLFFLVAGLVHPATAQTEKLGLLRIKAEYPVQVPRSYTFQVNLTVEYAFRDYFQIHSAIYEGPGGVLRRLLWEGETERLAEVGEKNYGVQLKSPSREGQWVVTGYAFFRSVSGWSYFADQERGPGLVEMSIKVCDNATLTLRTLHGDMPVSVDGDAYSTDQKGILTRQFRVLTQHSIAVPESVLIGEDWQAVFRSWNGTDRRNPKVLILNTDLLLIIDYQDEFRLNVISNVTRVTGTGWYPSGAVANFSAPAFVPQEGWQGLLGIRWRFTGWSGDVESVANRESIVMDHPHKVVANWIVDYEQLYYLTIAAVALVAGILAALVGRRIVRRRSAESVVTPTREFCMFCGANIDPNARFCSKCGKSQVSSG